MSDAESTADISGKSPTVAAAEPIVFDDLRTGGADLPLALGKVLPPDVLGMLDEQEAMVLIAMRRLDAQYPGLTVNMGTIGDGLGITRSTLSRYHGRLRAKLEVAGVLDALPLTIHDPRWRDKIEQTIIDNYPLRTQEDIARMLGITAGALRMYFSDLVQVGDLQPKSRADEERVMALHAGGLGSTAIAAVLGMPPRTVRAHLLRARERKSQPVSNGPQ